MVDSADTAGGKDCLQQPEMRSRSETRDGERKIATSLRLFKWEDETTKLHIIPECNSACTLKCVRGVVSPCCTECKLSISHQEISWQLDLFTLLERG
jgi:hypothetical protein